MSAMTPTMIVNSHQRRLVMTPPMIINDTGRNEMEAQFVRCVLKSQKFDQHLGAMSGGGRLDFPMVLKFGYLLDVADGAGRP
ncbi:hypothetical protein HAX54_018976 [Datura stramonium]|uniref:Uncharacterized protein n=1 Tax=Datura stramonium TaxID=4076 RepID=A0ABS8UNF9_DATST|nr:hypothetical protein [Datura stramonium]